MKSIIYIRLDSSPLPAATPNLIIKDVNTENYFCSFLGKQIMSKANSTSLTIFPGKLLIDYASVDKSAYDEVMQKYRDILLTLLSHTSKSANDFSLQLPYEFIDWLCCHENDDYREIGNHLSSTQISFTSIDLYDAIVDKVLLPQLKFFFKKQSKQIEFISFSLPLPQDNLLSRSLAINDIRIADIRDLKLYTEYESFCTCNGMTRIMNKETKKYGFINENGEEVFPCIYDFVSEFQNGIAVAFGENEWYILKSDNSRGLLCPINKYNLHSDFSDGVVRIYGYDDNNEYLEGFMDKNGKVMIPCQYSECGDFHEGLAKVKLYDEDDENYYGYIDKQGNEVIPCEYEYATDFQDGVAIVWNKDDSNGICIDKNGEEIFSSDSDITIHPPFSQGFALIEENIKAPAGVHFYGMIDKNGDEFLPCEYENIKIFSEGLAIIKTHDRGDDNPARFEIIDTEGNVVYSYKSESFQQGFLRFGNYSNGMVIVSGEISYFYLDRKGKKAIKSIKHGSDLSYKEMELRSFSDGMAVFSNGMWGKYGYINDVGEIIIPCIYKKARRFKDGFAAVQDESYKWGFIDNNGNVILPCLFDEVSNFSEGIAWVKKDEKYGIILKEWFVK